MHKQESYRVLTNCQYNITKQLDKKLEFLWHVDDYISEALKENDQECAKAFQEIKADEERHAKMLRSLVSSFLKNGN